LAADPDLQGKVASVTEESKDDSQQKESRNWLQRQIQRVRNIRRRDVVIAQIGPGARNIVVGTRNVQINIGNRNLTLPVLLIPLLLLVIIGFLVYPLAEPIWNPAQMTGQFRIAVAEFGEMDSNGKVRRADNGQVLSRWLFEALQDEYQQNANMEMAHAIEIWHDSQTDTEQNFKFGVMRGDTSSARRESAAKLAEKVNAHMVIYGNMVPDGESQGLDLEFYLSPQVNDETASIVGPHRLGKPILLPVPFDTDSPEANIVVGEKLETRGDALFWLTMGLTQQVLGRSEQALATLRRADVELADWPENDGKELLYFFIGREELFLEQTDHAEASFRKALEIEPSYARAQVGLGSTYLQRALAIEPDARLEEPKYLEQALDHHLRGLELALADEDAVIQAVARIALAKSYRLMGEAHYFLDDYDEANRFLDLAIAEVEQVTPLLIDTRQHRLLAQAYEAQGAAYLQQGDILRRQQDIEKSRARFELAKTAYQQCIEQGDKAFFDEILREKVIEQGCQRYYDVATEYAQKLEGEQP
jgi:tetratricopeptide (TPR) repeat protein